MSEKTQAAFWGSIWKGDQLALSDAVTLIQQIEAKQGASPISLTVSDVKVVKIMSPKKQLVGVYNIIRLGDQKPWLVVKTIGDTFSLSLYTAAQDWQPATRLELVKQDCMFLFDPPADDSRDAGSRDAGWEQDLHYTDDINHDASGVSYHIKPQGELSGKAIPQNSRFCATGEQPQFATIVEYVSTVEEDEGNGYPELAIFEIGEADSGLIHIMLGREVTSSDVDVVKH